MINKSGRYLENLISYFNSRVEQNSIHFLTSELITIFPLEVLTFFLTNLRHFARYLYSCHRV